MEKVKIVIATHKEYKMPESDLYLPVQVGAALKEPIGYQKDNEGENISEKNPYYCELTALYWAWKNLDSEYVGLAHYRRHFSNGKKEKDVYLNILDKASAENLVAQNDIILPKKRKYYIENLYSHYSHTLHIEPLDETGKILSEKYPEYVPEFELLKKRTSAHMFNMLIMKKSYLNNYCEWLFDILFELEKRCDPKTYDSFHARYPGRVSELLLDVYIRKNNLSYKEIPVMSTEPVNWVKKGSSFLLAKFGGKKYGKSF